MSITVQDVIDYANELIQGNGNISDDQGISFLNDGDKDFHIELIKRGVEASQIQESYRDVTVPPAGQGSTFLYPEDMLLLKTLSVNFLSPPSAGNYQNYVIPTQVDIGNTQQNQSFEFMRINQPIESPMIDDRGDWFEIFPAFTAQMNLEQAIRIFYYLIPTAFTSTAETIPYPASLNYQLLSRKIVSLYYKSLTRKEDADSFEKYYIDDIDKLVNILAKGADKPITTRGLGLSGYEF